MINNNENIYLSQVDLTSDTSVQNDLLIVMQMAHEDGEILWQCEVYSFLDDEADWCDEDIHWFLSQHGEHIYKRESTDRFFQNMRCDSPWDDDAHHLPWMRALMDSHMDY